MHLFDGSPRAGSPWRTRFDDSPIGLPRLIFIPTSIQGVLLIELEKREDERGFFARTYCEQEFAARGLKTRFVQCSVSFNRRSGTLRGMHYQAAPFEETKLVRCTRGAIFDVIVDLRRDSSTFKGHLAVTLSVENGKALYIPEGIAHGFQTLEDDTEVSYQISRFYSPEHARGVRWDDPAFDIPWPPAQRIIIERDRQYPSFQG